MNLLGVGALSGWILRSLVGKRRERRGMRALGRLDGLQWLFASWGRSCIQSEDEIPRVAGSETCVGFFRMAFRAPCPWICLAHLEAASGGSIGVTRVALAVVWSESVVEDVGRPIELRMSLVEVHEGHPCLDG